MAEEQSVGTSIVDALTIFSMLATAATILFSFYSLLGYSFLAKYYEQFGLRLIDVVNTGEHFFLRGFDISTREPILLTTSLAIVAFLTFVFFSISSARKYTLFPVAMSVSFSVLLAMFGFQYTKPLALRYAERDIYSKTTALRQLYCIESESASVEKFKTYAKEKSQKILVLARNSNQLIVFLEPTIVAQSPTVKTISIEVTNGDIIQQASATITGWGNNGSLSCFGGSD